MLRCLEGTWREENGEGWLSLYPVIGFNKCVMLFSLEQANSPQSSEVWACRHAELPEQRYLIIIWVMSHQNRYVHNCIVTQSGGLERAPGFTEKWTTGGAIFQMTISVNGTETVHVLQLCESGSVWDEAISAGSQKYLGKMGLWKVLLELGDWGLAYSWSKFTKWMATAETLNLAKRVIFSIWWCSIRHTCYFSKLIEIDNRVDLIWGLHTIEWKIKKFPSTFEDWAIFRR